MTGVPDRDGAGAVTTVLLVCHANTARSVMAHALLERMLADRGAAGRVRVRSGGIAPWARDGMIPSHDARIVLREVGLHLPENAFASVALAHHRHLIAAADLILTMSGEQRRMIEAFDEARGRPVLTLRELAGESGDIGDPAAQGEEAFRACRDDIMRCLARSIDRIIPPA